MPRIKEPVSSAQAFWLVGLSAAAGALLVTVASGKVPWLLDQLWSQEAAGWLSAIATVGAVWVALNSARTEHRRAMRLSQIEHRRALRLRDAEWKREDRLARIDGLRMGLVVAKPMLEEISAIRFNLSGMASFNHGVTSAEQWGRFRIFFVALETPVFDLFHGKLDALDPQTASAVVLAYAKLARLLSEVNRRIPDERILFGIEHVEAAKLARELAMHVEPEFEAAHKAVHKFVSIAEPALATEHFNS
ncbi:hypothetical protein GOY17_14020 [Lysobacter soli]|uniref:hypothetical protein n=1 Tax=Lysobacter soli TaxID=453783 RepID=UPI0012ED482C|nr:hypothetical protein [Lysobacter soli]QGW65925.1 hypothetical protein GOY17_14020 [Lysobacter soli]